MAASRKPIEKKTCSCCKELLPRTSFYQSKNTADKDGLVRWCKPCIIKHSVIATGEINEEQFQGVLKKIDKPFFKDLLDSAEIEYQRSHFQYTSEDVKRHGKEIIGLYFKNLNSLKQTNTKTYADSEQMLFYRNAAARKESMKGSSSNKTPVSAYDDEFVLTEDIVRLFGEGYPLDEYRWMYKKYEKLKDDYSIQTSLHQEALATYVRFKVKEEIATAKGDVAAAAKWYQAALNAADEGKLTPKRITQADLQGGISAFSDIFRAVEQAVDVIPILPQFKFQPHDAVDFNIWCFVNYIRDLQGKDQVSYEAVYKFYDRKKQEYIEQYGDPNHIFDDDPSESNRERIKQFITLPDDYDG